jgi:hypothetical protein
MRWVNLVARWSLKFKKKLNWSWYDWFDKLILNNLVKIQFKFKKKNSSKFFLKIIEIICFWINLYQFA